MMETGNVADGLGSLGSDLSTVASAYPLDFRGNRAVFSTTVSI